MDLQSTLDKLQVGINMKMMIRKYIELYKIPENDIQDVIQFLRTKKLYEIQNLNSIKKKQLSQETEILSLTESIKN